MYQQQQIVVTVQVFLLTGKPQGTTGIDLTITVKALINDHNRYARKFEIWKWW